MKNELKDLINEVIENKSYYKESEYYIEYVFALDRAKAINEKLRKVCTNIEMITPGNFRGEFGNITEYEVFFQYYRIDIDDFCFCAEYVKDGSIFELERITFKINRNFLQLWLNE